MAAKEWTEAKLHAFIMGVLRKGLSRFPAKYNALKGAFLGKKINPSSGRMCSFYVCAGCSEGYPSTKVQVDHIRPIVPTTGFKSWDEVINRAFCKEDGLQVLCLSCHKAKSLKENATRREGKKK